MRVLPCARSSPQVQAASGEDDDFLSASAPDAKAYESHSGSILDTLEDMKEKVPRGRP